MPDKGDTHALKPTGHAPGTTAPRVFVTRVMLSPALCTKLLEAYDALPSMGYTRTAVREDFAELFEVFSVVVDTGKLALRRMDDGLAVDLVGAGNLSAMKAHLLCLVKPCSAPPGRYVDTYYLTRPVEVAGDSVAGCLDGLYSNWGRLRSHVQGTVSSKAKSGKSRRLHPTQALSHTEALVVQCSTGTERWAATVSGAELARAEGVVPCVSSDGLEIRLTRDGGNGGVSHATVRCEDPAFECCFDLYGGMYGAVLQHHTDAVYVHGMRALLGRVSAGTKSSTLLYTYANNTCANNTCAKNGPFASDEASLVDAVQRMKLSAARQFTGAAGEALKELGVGTHAMPVVPQEGRLSVYPVRPHQSAPRIVNQGAVRFLGRYGVEAGRASVLLCGAYAVAAQGALFESEFTQPVALDALPGSDPGRVTAMAEVLKSEHCPTYFVNWLGSVVAVHVVREEGVVFALSGRVFAGALLTSAAVSAAVSAAGEALVPVPTGDSLQEAAARLALVDALATHAKWAPHSRSLRSAWIATEQLRLVGSVRAREGAERYFIDMSVLMQLASLPRGVNWWATVPFLPGA